MLVTLLSENELHTLSLPVKVKGQYWITDKDESGNYYNLLEIEAVNGEWRLKSNNTACICSPDGGSAYKYQILRNYDIYQIALLKTGKVALICIEPDTLDRKKYSKFFLKNNNARIVIGRENNSDIWYSYASVSSYHATLIYENSEWKIEDNSSTNGTYVNGRKLVGIQKLNYGDVVYIVGLKIIVFNGFIALNNPDGKVMINNGLFSLQNYPAVTNISEEDIELEPIDYYYRTPRFKRDIQKKEIKVDAPPASFIREEMPISLVIGPSMTMGLASLVTAGYSIYNAVNNGNIMSAIPSISMSVGMLLGTILWPIFSKKYEKKRNKKKEHQRIIKYSDYLDSIKDEIDKEVDRQTEIIIENFNPPVYWGDIIKSNSRKLWEKTTFHNDFLQIRVGLGDVPADIKFGYQERRFTMDEDDLQDKMLELCENTPKLKSVPIVVSFVKDYIFGVIGSGNNNHRFFNNMLVQLIGQYSYDEVKLAFIMNETQEKEYLYVRRLPHVWDDDKQNRLLATNYQEIKELSNYFERVIANRSEMKDESISDALPYYMIFVFDKKLADKAEMLKMLYKKKHNLNISVVYITESLRELPKECIKFIELNGNKAKIFEKSDIAGNRQEIIPEYYNNTDLDELASNLANTQLDIADSAYNLPKMLTFLDMYGVGKIEHLNADVRWKENNPVKSLEAAIGVDTSGELFKLDLHEKFHGPHGLVAGMTGSGKSEFIMTFILSLALNYHPYEVAFVLIDYKGGGMAKAFEKLPHTAGIITNLDGAAVNRSLISIQSELKRRQAIFSEAGSLMGESNIDIYKYQQLYREGKVREPLQHLFIISDEFAELKTQQPEFMEQLVSAARIGRSLGVHLILATQKPAGVVDDQIWSNSKFRICLKVQDRADSMDMLKRADAAELVDTGRFYLQVGYNELFELGQSAWAGAPYVPSEKIVKQRDTSVELVDRNGNVIASTKLEKQQSGERRKKQLDEITHYLAKLANEENVHVKPLWLEPIADKIFVETLRGKYSHTENKFYLNPIIGEYDDPARQRQCLLTLPLSEDGNALVYGTAGNGKTTFLTTTLYSLISTHTPDEVTVYVLDFSSETMRAFAKAPHVGDVLVSGDDDRIEGMFKLLNAEILKRKQICSEFGGDYASYVAAGNTDMPNIVVMINNYAGFSEIYEDYEDYVQYQSREGVKYGIYYIITALSTNAIRYRLQQNFRQMFMLQMNDSNEYATVLGSTGGMIPSKYKGRGLIKTNEVYEFQVAYASTDVDTIFDSVRKYCSQLLEYYGERKSSIPVLPKNITYDSFEDVSLEHFPVGMSKEDVEVQHINLREPRVYAISGNDFVEMRQLTFGIVEGLNEIPDTEVIFIDGNGDVYENDISCRLVNDDIEDEIVEIYNKVLYRNNHYKACGGVLPEDEEYEEIAVVLYGLDGIRNYLSDDAIDKLKICMDKIMPEYNITFIVVDDSQNMFRFSREPWYKHHGLSNRGLFVGNGITNQYALSVQTTNPELRKKIEAGFGYVVNDGEVILSKFVISRMEAQDE